MLFYYQEFAGVGFIVDLKLIEINASGEVAAIPGGFVSHEEQLSDRLTKCIGNLDFILSVVT